MIRITIELFPFGDKSEAKELGKKMEFGKGIDGDYEPKENDEYIPLSDEEYEELQNEYNEIIITEDEKG